MRSGTLLACWVTVAAVAGLEAQTVTRHRPFIRASGEGVVSSRPDQVTVNAGVTTQAPTAQEAAEQNAAVTAAVIAALRQLLGQNADIRTVGYSVSPVYRYPQGGTPQLTGYSATNTVQVVHGDLAIAGRILDTAVGAGATNVSGLRFGLKDPGPAQTQALRAATQKARTNAEAIATGLGARLGAVVSAEEAAAARVVAVDTRTAAVAGATTPVEPGNVEVRATVILEVEIAP